MLTEGEFTALLQLLQRLPLSQAEILWLNSIIAKLKPPELEVKNDNQQTNDSQQTNENKET